MKPALPALSRPCTRSKQQGMTLVEVMIGLALGLIVIGAILSTYLTVARTQVTQLGESQLAQNSGSAMGLIGQTARNAGFIDPSNDWGEFIEQLRKNPEAGIFELFAKRSAKKPGGPFSAIQLDSNGSTDSLTLRREISLPAGEDADCLAHPYTAADTGVDVCQFIFDRKARSLSVVASSPGKATSNPEPLVVDGALFDYQLRAALQPVGNFYSATASAKAADTFYTEINSSTDWSRAVGLEVCLVLASPTDPQNRATSYTRCDGTSAAAPSTGPAYLFRIVRGTFQLRNRSAVMPILRQDSS